MLYVNPMAGNSPVLAARSGGPALRAPGEAEPAREKAALQEFERLFLFQLLREMRKTVPDNALFGKPAQQDFMEEMLDDHMAGEMARSGQFGIAKQMEAQMNLRPARPHGLAPGERSL